MSRAYTTTAPPLSAGFATTSLRCRKEKRASFSSGDRFVLVTR